jgi:hypothetical protein
MLTTISKARLRSPTRVHPRIGDFYHLSSLNAAQAAIAIARTPDDTGVADNIAMYNVTSRE